MSTRDPDRPTPPDPLPRPLPRAQPPRPRAKSVDDEGRAVHGAGTLRAPLAAQHGATPPPLPARAQERKATPQSGGIEAQRSSPIVSPSPIRVEMVDSEPPRSKPPSRGDWSKLGYKLATAAVGALVLVIGAGAFYVVTTLNAKSEAKLANKKAETATVVTDKTADRAAAIEAYLAADAARDACVEKQLRDALARGTGHVVTALPSGETLWIEQNRPKAVARTIWLAPTWFTVEVCPAKPSPPKAPP